MKKDLYKYESENSFDNKIENILDKYGIVSRWDSSKIPQMILLTNKNMENDEEEISVEDFETELKQMKRSVNYLNGQIRELNKKIEKLTDMKLTDELQAFGFQPITKDVLVKYSVKQISRCETLILKEIKETRGDTDPDKISIKYDLPLDLVAGCFDKLLEDGTIGEE